MRYLIQKMKTLLCYLMYNLLFKEIQQIDAAFYFKVVKIIIYDNKYVYKKGLKLKMVPRLKILRMPGIE